MPCYVDPLRCIGGRGAEWGTVVEKMCRHYWYGTKPVLEVRWGTRNPFDLKRTQTLLGTGSFVGI